MLMANAIDSYLTSTSDQATAEDLAVATKTTSSGRTSEIHAYFE